MTEISRNIKGSGNGADNILVEEEEKAETVENIEEKSMGMEYPEYPEPPEPGEDESIPLPKVPLLQKAMESRSLKRKREILDAALSDPRVYFDELPQPYRFLNKILDNEILVPVNHLISKIEEQKKTNSYEGNLKEIYTSGSIDIQGITAMGTEVSYIYGHDTRPSKVLLGDYLGNLYLVDTSRKIILDKIEVEKGSRVLEISLCTIEWVDTMLSRVVVLSRGSVVLRIYHFKHNENKLYLHYTMNIANDPTPTDSYESLPLHILLSQDALFLAIIKYKGEMVLVELPEPPEPSLKEDADIKSYKGIKYTGGTPITMMGKSPTPQIEMYGLFDQNIESIACRELTVEKQLRFKLPGREHPGGMKDPFEHPQVVTGEVEEGVPVSKGKAPPPPPAPKGKGGTAPAKGKPVEEEEMDLGQWKGMAVIGDRVLDHIGGDCSRILGQGVIIPDICFHRRILCYGSEVKSSRMIKHGYITTTLIVGYRSTFDIEFYKIQDLNNDNLVKEFTLEYFHRLIQKAKKRQLPTRRMDKRVALVELLAKIGGGKAPGAGVTDKTTDKTTTERTTEPVLVKCLSMSYHITCICGMDMDENIQYLGVGMEDGSVIVYNLALGIEKYILSKNNGSVLSMDFLEDKYLFTGSATGSVHIYHLEKEGKHKFRAQNHQDFQFPIVTVSVCHIGVAVAVDIKGNMRLYDLIRQRKIGKMNPQLKNSAQSWEWSLFPYCPMGIKKEQLVVVSQTSRGYYTSEKPKELTPTIPEGEEPPPEFKDLDLPYHTQKSAVMLFQEPAAYPLQAYRGDRLIHNIRSLKQGKYLNFMETKEKTLDKPFYINESLLYIFKFEDILLGIYPQLSQYIRRGMSLSHAFSALDPERARLGMTGHFDPQSLIKEESASSIRSIGTYYIYYIYRC